MAAEKSPAFQFYPKDFLASDSVSLMTTEQIGAYILLLCHAWQRPDGLPSSLDALAKLSRCSPRRFESAIWPGVSACFQQTESGAWINDRLEKERQKQVEFREAASRAGKRSAEQRALNARSTHVEIPLQRPSNGNPTLRSSSSSPSPDTTSKNEVVEPPPPPRLNGARNPDRMTHGPIVLWASWFRDDIVPLVATHFGGDRDAAYAPALAWVVELDAANAATTPGRDVLAKPREWWRTLAAEKWGSESCQTTPVTDRERRQAEEVRRKAFGRCPHDPPCGSYSACVTTIALEQRHPMEKVRA